MSQRALLIQREYSQVGTIANLTGVYESIASMRIAKVKEKVTRSQNFFAELWQIYTQLRVNPESRLIGKSAVKREKPNVFLVLTSEGGLSGDIDQRIVQTVMKQLDPTTTDLIVIGAHGATQFVQAHAKIKRYFRLPDVDQAIDVSPIIAELIGYRNPTVWFQRYLSLSQQEPGRIDLLARVRDLGSDSNAQGEVISPRDYIFEPNVDDVVNYLEGVMMGIALSQVILESRLAQYASRFTAMTSAKKRAGEMAEDLKMGYSRAKRNQEDDVIKEAINAIHALAGDGQV